MIHSKIESILYFNAKKYGLRRKMEKTVFSHKNCQQVLPAGRKIQDF